MKNNTLFAQMLAVLLVGNAVLLLAALTVPGLAWLVIGAGLVITLAMWLGVRAIGRRALTEAANVPAAAQDAATPPKEAPAARPERPAQPPEAAAIQLLSILQREGRLIDFLQEDIRSFDDAQIGAAVRNVHEGCRQALAEHVTLEPVMSQPEGSTVTVEPGFDARAVRLAGHVTGEPPFTGALRHRGWRVARIDLPELLQRQDRIVAAAEVEVGG